MKTLFLALALLSTSAAYAEAHSFICVSKGYGDLYLTVNAKTAKLESVEAEAQYEFKGKRDLSYKGSKERIRYTGFVNANTTNVVMSKELAEGGMEMRNGRMGGFMQVQDVEDGFSSTSYVCFEN